MCFFFNILISLSPTACAGDHHVAAVVSIFVETRCEESDVDQNEDRNEGDVNVIVLHVRLR